MTKFSWLILAIFFLEIEGYNNDIVDIFFDPSNSAFMLDVNRSARKSDTIYFSTASNIDSYSIRTDLGISKRSISFTGDKEIQKEIVHSSVHVFNSEVDEKSKTIHFVCHALNQNDVQPKRFTQLTTCCLISINTSFSHEYTSCALKVFADKSVSICQAQGRLPAVLWKQKTAPLVSLSYTFFTKSLEGSKNGLEDGECHIPSTGEQSVFHLLPTATVVRSVPDAIRELGRSLLLQIPRRELKIGEEFIVPIRLKRGDDVSDFTLRCEIPSNSYVEFVRVIWPGGLSPGKHETAALNDQSLFSSAVSGGTDPGQLNSEALDSGGTVSGLQNVWDVFHRTVLSQKRNITEIVARFREDLARPVHSTKHAPATEVYKLLFRVVRPAPGSPDRVAPRIFWSLVSLTRRNSADRTAGGSPIVTRLNIESSELKHLAMVLKTSALVNLAALTGQPAVYPVWVYGLTHDGQLIDVTKRATCHSGDDAVIHFASDDCTKLGFSGAELDGSPGLPLVAKLDGRSATSTLLVWFPKAPALKLVVDGGSEEIRSVESERPTLVLKRITTGPGVKSSSAFGVSGWPFSTNGSNSGSPSPLSSLPSHLGSSSEQLSYQFARIRVLARFILAGSVLYDKDVLGGKIDQYVDVTDFTADRIRVEELEWLEGTTGTLQTSSHVAVNHYGNSVLESGRLVLIGRSIHPDKTSGPGWASLSDHTFGQSIHAWLVGQRAGRIRVRLAPIDRAKLKAAVPPGLAKQLKDQKSDLIDHSDLDSFGDDSLWAATVKDDPTLDIIVRDEPGTWPVGLSVQIVTDFSVVLSQIVDHETSFGSTQSSKSPGSRFHHPVGDANAYTAEHAMPLYSGLYAAQFQLQAGKLAHSGAVATGFNEKLRRAANEPDRLARPIKSSNRSGTVQARATEDRTNGIGLIVIWLHMSDGTTILWNRLKEISQSIGRPLPFKLVLDNLRPDLFMIQETNEHTHPVRRKRSAGSSWWEPNQTVNRRSFVQHDVSDRDAGSFSTSPKIHSRGPWTGPTVRLIRPGASYSGDILDVSVNSPDDQVLVPKTRVQAEMLPTNMGVFTGQPQLPEEGVYQNTRAKYDDQSHAPNPNYPVPPGIAEETQVPNPIPPLPGVQHGPSNHGYVALKDAPGLRNLPTNQRQGHLDQSPARMVKGDQLHETSLSDQRGDEKANTILALADGMGDVKPATVLSSAESSSTRYNTGSAPTAVEIDSSSGSGSRPALEMSMYILLGLFALVGLVFAVNCGAVVARYRWERVGRRRSALGGADRALDAVELSQPDHTDSNAHAPLGSAGTNEGKADASEEKATKRYSKLLMPFRNKRKPLLHRDNNWVWIGRDKTAEMQTDTKECPVVGPLGDRSRSLHSPLLGMGASSQLTASRKQGGGSSSTTAVLSVGEADMLLMHSPYHQDAWRDTLRSTAPEQKDIESMPVGWPYPMANIESMNFPMTQYAHALNTGSATVGRPTRRHTTGVLTQRNYQGQECSIRIISNPMSQSASSAHDADAVRNQLIALDASGSVPQSFHNGPDVSRMGSASASVQRKHRSSQMWTNDGSFVRNDAEVGKNEGPMHWNQGLGPYPSPWMMMGHPAGVVPPPNQPAPPIPYGHFRPEDAAYYWEAVMYRSWVRPRTGWKLPQPELDPETDAQFTKGQDNHVNAATNITVSSLNARHPRSFTNGNSRIKGDLDHTHAVHTLKTLRESREHTFDRHDVQPQPAVPFPPVRTTSRTVDSRTLEVNKQRRKLSGGANPRPLSLPQNFQATNELYGALTSRSNMANASTELCLDSAHPETCPSEESLWWYHPVRRRRKRRHDRQPSDPADADLSTTHKPLAETGDPIDYACPATCDCKCNQPSYKPQLQPRPTRGVIQPIGLTSAPAQTTSGITPNTVNASTLNSISDLAWDRDLLALSHDGLVAYFAGMKESSA